MSGASCVVVFVQNLFVFVQNFLYLSKTFYICPKLFAFVKNFLYLSKNFLYLSKTFCISAKPFVFVQNFLYWSKTFVVQKYTLFMLCTKYATCKVNTVYITEPSCCWRVLLKCTKIPKSSREALFILRSLISF